MQKLEKSRLQILSGPRTLTLYMSYFFPRRLCLTVQSYLSRVFKITTYYQSSPVLNDFPALLDTCGAASQPSVYLSYPTADCGASPPKFQSTIKGCSTHTEPSMIRSHLRDYFWLFYSQLDFVPSREKEKSLQQQLFYT